jgi:hypothetical protein
MALRTLGTVGDETAVLSEIQFSPAGINTAAPKRMPLSRTGGASLRAVGRSTFLRSVGHTEGSKSVS